MLDENEVKYFLSNMVIDDKQVTLEWLLWVAFSRWPIERCFEIGKRDFGMDHFEMRNWQGIHRHFYITQLTMLFCTEVQQCLREKNSGKHVPDSRTSSPRGRCLDYGPIYEFINTRTVLPTGRPDDRVLSAQEPASQTIPPKENLGTLVESGHKHQQNKKLCAV